MILIQNAIRQTTYELTDWSSLVAPITVYVQILALFAAVISKTNDTKKLGNRGVFPSRLSSEV